jgi:hypothetical protein
VETGRKAERQKCGGGGGKEAGFSARSTLERERLALLLSLWEPNGLADDGSGQAKDSRRPVRVQRPTHS